MMTRDRKTREFAQLEASSENRKNWQTLTIPNLNVYKVCWLFRIHRGAAAVEFAIVAPVFMRLVFGMIEYGQRRNTFSSRELVASSNVLGSANKNGASVMRRESAPLRAPKGSKGGD